MDDRELLELAAKAVGTHFVAGESWDEGAGWNPLTDDGDALRLAVKLNFHICIDADSAGAVIVEWDFDESGTAMRSVEQDAPIGGDDEAATRRAIVRAAAEIGKSL